MNDCTRIKLYNIGSVAAMMQQAAMDISKINVICHAIHKLSYVKSIDEIKMDVDTSKDEINRLLTEIKELLKKSTNQLKNENFGIN